MATLSAFSLVVLLALHFVAVMTAWATRVAAGSRAEGVLQVMFLMTMAGVGLSAWYCHDLGLGIPSGLTLTAMVLTAVVDFRRTHEPAHVSSLSMHG